MPKKRQPSAPSVWVVEQLGGDDEWRAIDMVVGSVRTRRLRSWQDCFPGRSYRLTRYVSTRAEGGKSRG